MGTGFLHGGAMPYDANLVAANIKKDVTIHGVKGTFTFKSFVADVDAALGQLTVSMTVTPGFVPYAIDIHLAGSEVLVDEEIITASVVKTTQLAVNDVLSGNYYDGSLVKHTAIDVAKITSYSLVGTALSMVIDNYDYTKAFINGYPYRVWIMGVG